jgi:hypothetical protein
MPDGNDVCGPATSQPLYTILCSELRPILLEFRPIEQTFYIQATKVCSIIIYYIFDFSSNTKVIILTRN